MFKSTLKSKPNEDISILVQPDNHPWNYICECGDANDLTVKEILQSNAIFISHTHIDHFVNFDTIIRHQIGVQRRIVICGPKGIAKQVQSRILSYTWNLIDEGAITYEIRELLADDHIQVYEIEPPLWELKELPPIKNNTLLETKDFIVQGILLDHKTPTLSYKFTAYDTIKIDMRANEFKGGVWVKELKEAFEKQLPETILIINDQKYKAGELFHLLHIQQGATLGIIMDHAAHEENHNKILNFFNNCDTVYIESFYKNEDHEFATLNYHSYAAKSGEIMRKANIKNAIPVHFSRKYNPEDLTALVQEFQAACRSEKVTI